MKVPATLSAITHKYTLSTSTHAPVIAVGVRPSGEIHFGNMMTLAMSFFIAKSITSKADKRPSVLLTLCDIDRPSSKTWPISEKKHIRHFDTIPDPKQKGKSLLDGARENLETLIRGFEEFTGIPCVTQTLTEVQNTKEYREGLRRVIENRSLLQQIFPNLKVPLVPVFPICTVCDCSSPYPTAYKKETFDFACVNSTCNAYNVPQQVNIHDTSVRLAVNYFLDPLRDKTVRPFADIHVFGGDYLEKHAGTRTKIEKINNVIKTASKGKTPALFVGPKFYDINGEPMSKSKDNGITYTDLIKEHTDSREVCKKLLSVIRATLAFPTGKLTEHETKHYVSIKSKDFIDINRREFPRGTYVWYLGKNDK